MSDFYPEFPAVLDNTIVSNFAACERKAYYSFIRSASPTERSVHLVAGKTFAKGLEVTRNEFYVKGQPIDDAINAGALAMIIAWGDFEPAWSSDLEGKNSPKTLDAMIGALQYYFTVWNPYEDIIKPADMGGGRLGIEFSFAIPLDIPHPDTGDPLIYAGRSDLITEYNGTLMLVDEKTTGQLGPTWAKKWDLRSQFMGYTWAAREYGYDVAGCIIRGVSILKKSYGHAQSIVYHQPWLIDNWHSQLYARVQRMIDSWKSGRWMQAFNDECNAYAGCPYRILCSSPDPEKWLPVQFYQRKWDPIHHFD